MKLVLVESDFENLWDTSMQWGEEWKSKSERFHPPISYEWKRAYWFYSYANLLIARAYLNGSGYETQTAWDEGMDSWIVVTDYDFEKGKR
jgi:hypothetical protein